MHVVGILGFEVAIMMSKLFNLWKILRDEEVDRLRRYISDSVGVKKLVSDDDDFILGLITGELFEIMFTVVKYVTRLGNNYCSDPSLKDFDHIVNDWINNGVQPFGWEIPWEMMESEAELMKNFISRNADLYDQMKLLSDLERNLIKDTSTTSDGPDLLELQKKVELKQQEVEDLKEASLWNMTYDYVGILLVRNVLTILSRIKHVYGVPQTKDSYDHDHHVSSPSIFSKYKLLDAPPDTLGAAALELRYAKIVIEIEKMMSDPFKSSSGKHDLFKLLPGNIRDELSEKLPNKDTIDSLTSSSLKDLAAEWKETITEILEWLAPLAHNTKKWHSKRNYNQGAYVSKSNVLLVETLHFASQHKTEATVMELLVGLQYHCRYQDRHREAMLEVFREERERKAASLEVVGSYRDRLYAKLGIPPTW